MVGCSRWPIRALPGYSTASRITVNNGGTLTVSAGTDWTATNIYYLLSYNGTGFQSGSTLGIDTTQGNFTDWGVYGNMGLTKLGGNTLMLTNSVPTPGGPDHVRHA